MERYTDESNLAYDLSRFDTVADLREKQAKKARKQAEQTKPELKVSVRSEAKTGSPFLIVAGAAAALALLTVPIVNNARVNEAENHVAEQREKLDEATRNRDMLQVQLDSTINVNYVVDFAMNELDMDKPSREQVEYMSVTDKNLIVANDDSSDSIFSVIADWLKDTMEYIGL